MGTPFASRPFGGTVALCGAVSESTLKQPASYQDSARVLFAFLFTVSFLITCLLTHLSGLSLHRRLIIRSVQRLCSLLRQCGVSREINRAGRVVPAVAATFPVCSSVASSAGAEKTRHAVSGRTHITKAKRARGGSSCGDESGGLAGHSGRPRKRTKASAREKPGFRSLCRSQLHR